MRALAIAVAVMMSAAAFAQESLRPPPPGQPTGPSAPAEQFEGFYYGGPEESWRYRGTVVAIERERMEEQLAEMRRLLERSMDRVDRRGRQDLMKLKDGLDDTQRMLRNAPEVRRSRPRPPPPPPAPVVHPISEHQLQQLIKAIERESFSDGKMRVLEAASSHQHFLVSQVLKILPKFSFSQDRLKAMRVLWPHVLDRDNAYHLYSAFKFQSEKDELKRIISQ